MSYKSIWLPLLLERVGVRRIKTTIYIPLIPTFSATAPALLYLLHPCKSSLKGEGASTCVDTYAFKGKAQLVLGRDLICQSVNIDNMFR